MSQTMSRKQQLLKRHRRNKRIGLLIALVLLIVMGVLVAWWLPLVPCCCIHSPSAWVTGILTVWVGARRACGLCSWRYR